MKSDIKSIMQTVQLARMVEQGGEIQRRNNIADCIFANPKRRKVTKDGLTIETWWFPEYTSWVTQVKDADGNQIGEADYSGNKMDAAAYHLAGLFRLLPPLLVAADPDALVKVEVTHG